MPSKSLSRSSLLSFQKYSSLLAGNDPYIPLISSYQLLETTVLSSAAATVEFTNLVSSYSAQYDHLEIRYTMRSSTTDVVDDLWITVNGDGSANYANHRMRGGSGETAANTSTSYNSVYDGGYANVGNGAPAGSYGAGIVTILEPFNTNKYSAFKVFGGGMYTASVGYVGFNSGLWLNANAIDSIKFDLRLGSYMAGSRFSLYGWRS